MANIFSADPEQLQMIAKLFQNESSEINRVMQMLYQKYQPLRNQGWVGRGADAFFEVMEGDVFPGLRRLEQYFADSAETAGSLAKRIEDGISFIHSKCKVG